MASYQLEAFNRVDDISIIGAVEQLNATQIQVAFWVTDPNQCIIYPKLLSQAERHDYLWQHTCFELFLGIQQQDVYREINLAPSGAWQAYAFEEYRYPECMPPAYAQDIQLIQLQRTKYGINATLDIKHWLHQQQVKMAQVYLGLTAVVETANQHHYFALQHSGQQADFHNKRDWLHQF
ncbi:DOMON-like domain-containing protein [Moraxella sp. ZY210820]|uniref:DOMON-like domain-containing protein n=1 Tax=unclassified Moraxella TaxID=2685852 RepID=UPI002730469A|nr:DOMON-like domain-containing protein [Moraxella sp. ZY210820]WLF82896.1 DOMON-like domain-containing protein [Moraxella sp. ZY210820]